MMTSMSGFGSLMLMLAFLVYRSVVFSFSTLSFTTNGDVLARSDMFAGEDG